MFSRKKFLCFSCRRNLVKKRVDFCKPCKKEIAKLNRRF